jgi:hypothetical protein
MKQSLVIAAAVLATACTTVDYTSQRFPEQSAGHRAVAVLPFEMVLTGRQPAGMTDERLAAIEEAESLAFQTAFYNSLLDRSSARRKHPITIDIQPPQTTNRILSERGIGIRESWAIPAEELAVTLAVDAVIRTTVQKTRYLSDAASYGIDVGTAILYEATEGRFPWVVPPGMTTTSTIWSDATLVEADGGDVLWKVVVERATDWTLSADAVVVDITRLLAKKFPYRA